MSMDRRDAVRRALDYVAKLDGEMERQPNSQGVVTNIMLANVAAVTSAPSVVDFRWLPPHSCKINIDAIVICLSVGAAPLFAILQTKPCCR